MLTVGLIEVIIQRLAVRMWRSKQENPDTYSQAWPLEVLLTVAL